MVRRTGRLYSTFLFLAACAFAQSGQPILTAGAIKSLSLEQAHSHRPVLLTGIVTEIIPEWWAFTLQDSSGAVYIANGKELPAALQTGVRVQVAGKTESGNFAPAVRAGTTRILGPSAMPKARPAAWSDFATGSCDNEYVEVQGIVRSIGPVEPPAWEWKGTSMRLDIGGNFIWVYVRAGEALPPDGRVDDTVRVRGVCLVFSNSRRQFQGTVLNVSRWADVQLVHQGSEDPFTAPLQPISHLFGFRATTGSSHRVKVAGIATLQVAGGVYLQQDGDGILVRTNSAPPIHRGDRVEAAGFPAAVGFGTVLEDGVVRVVGKAADPAPRDLTAAAVLTRVLNAPAAPSGVLLRVKGRVIDRARTARDETLFLTDGQTSFTARLASARGSLASVAPGSQVSVTGVSTMQLDDRGLPQSFELLMRSPGDVLILQRPPWLTRGIAVKSAGVLLAFLVCAVVLLAILRRRVEKQTAVIRNQYETQAALQRRYTELVENASDLVYIRDLEGRLLQVNRGTEAVTGYSREELLGMNVIDLLVPEERERARTQLVNFQGPGERGSSEWRFRTKDGRELHIETKLRFLNEDGQPPRVECIGRDVTARQRAQLEVVSQRNSLEEQLQHAQKLESVGQLAGGVAHDFNNMLTIIGGYAQMALDQVPQSSAIHDYIIQISGAADRAASLTRQLLLFSRRQKAAPKTLSLNQLVGNLEKMLRRLIGEDIRLVLSLNAGQDSISADPGHIEQVVMNLVVNARDAMQHNGGTIEIRTADFLVDAEYAAGHLGVAEGRYVTLYVTDTGSGMPPEVVSRIFEPFFTTKEQGKGTGLGLSMVYGIVKQSGGAVFVDSQPGRGTTFEILLPLTPSADHPSPERDDAGPADSGLETILLAEDESAVRKYIREVLASHGYTVLEAATGEQALQIAARHAGPIHLLLSDVVMPEMDGVTLAERFSAVRPGTRVLHMSGYADRLLTPIDAETLLEKPFTPAALLSRVREALGAGQWGGPPGLPSRA